MEPDVIIIKCSPFIPEQVMDEFVASLPSLNIVKDREPIYRQRSIEHLDIKPIYDAVIEFISKGEFLKSVLKEGASALVIETLKAVFKKVIGTKKITTRSRLKINLSYRDLTAEFHIEDKCAIEDIDHCINSFSKLIESNQIINDSSNKKYQKSHIIHNIRYDYNHEKKLFLPYDYKKRKDEILNRIQDFDH